MPSNPRLAPTAIALFVGLFAALAGACKSGPGKLEDPPPRELSKKQRQKARQTFEGCQVVEAEDAARKLACPGPAMVLIQGPSKTYAKGKKTLEAMQPLLEKSGDGERRGFDIKEVSFGGRSYPILTFEERADGEASYVQILGWENEKKLATCATGDPNQKTRCRELLKALVTAGLPEGLTGGPTVGKRGQKANKNLPADAPTQVQWAGQTVPLPGSCKINNQTQVACEGSSLTFFDSKDSERESRRFQRFKEALAAKAPNSSFKSVPCKLNGKSGHCERASVDFSEADGFIFVVGRGQMHGHHVSFVCRYQRSAHDALPPVCREFIDVQPSEQSI